MYQQQQYLGMVTVTIIVEMAAWVATLLLGVSTGGVRPGGGGVVCKAAYNLNKAYPVLL